MSPTLISTALTLALVESLGLAALLLRVKDVPGLKLLVAFLCGVAIWVLSCELPSWLGPGLDPIGAALVAFSPLTSAIYLHFVLVLCAVPNRRNVVRVIYGVGGATTVVALWIPAGRYHPWRGFDSIFFPSPTGWLVAAVWVALAVAGHLVLFRYVLQRKGPPRGQLMAMCAASGWGALCMSGYGFAPLGIDLYPFPLLFLPLYPLILVYGILRYQLMIVNTWARRGLAWALLVALGSAAVIGLAAVPLPFGTTVPGWRFWALAVPVLLASGMLLDRFRRVATRLIYPGSNLTDGDADRWRAMLERAETFNALEHAAAHILSAQLRTPISVVVQQVASTLRDTPATPALVCERRQDRWHTTLVDWDAAPPGPRYVAQLFGTALTESAQRLEQAMSLALREREHQQRERLAELGALAATVAHDIRNPLNIIAMAAATAPADVRKEIATQTQRIAQLATDLLDYAKSWQLEKQPLELADYLRTTAARYPEVEIAPDFDPSLKVDADPRRLRQALLNLLDNAREAIQSVHPGGRIRIDAQREAAGAIELAICDNGSGIPSEIRETLFQPFVSKRPEGTGLGLAIVAKIMQAHGGSVRLTPRPGWATCFILTFPPPTSP